MTSTIWYHILYIDDGHTVIHLHSFINEISMKDADINLNIALWNELCMQAKNKILQMFLMLQVEKYLSAFSILILWEQGFFSFFLPF